MSIIVYNSLDIKSIALRLRFMLMFKPGIVPVYINSTNKTDITLEVQITLKLLQGILVHFDTMLRLR